MKVGIFNPNGVPAGLRWQRLAPGAGHQIVDDRDIDVLFIFGGLRSLLRGLKRAARTKNARVVWWFTSSTALPKRNVTELGRRLFEFAERRLSRVDEVLVGDSHAAEILASTLALQAVVVFEGSDAVFAQALDDAGNRAAGHLPSSAQDPFVPRLGHVLPYSVPHDVPGFTVPDHKRTRAFSPSPIRSETWFDAFASRAEEAIGREFLPVCRMSDGEFLFRFGWQPHLPNEPAWRRVGARLRQAARSVRGQAGFQAGHSGRYQSARYTHEEQRHGIAKFDEAARFLTRHGVLALHLSHEKYTFQERFYPSIASWLREFELPLDTRNYVPFYFVYALLLGPRRRAILSGKRVLVVNGATGEKRDRIVAGLEREGAQVVHWESISPARSLFDTIDVAAWRGKVDLALIGAGVGKINVFPQLQVLNVPCLDAGYVFEVWADPDSAKDRFYCTPDREDVC